MLGDSLSNIIGKRISSEFSKEIKQTVCSFPEVQGAYDLVLHNYGPDLMIGSVHIEVPDTLTVAELDKLEHRITETVLEKHKVKALVDMFGRETLAELDFNQVEKLV